MKKNALLLGLLVLVLIGLPATIFLKNREELRSRAEKSTVLSFSQTTSNTSTIQTNIGSTVSLDLIINPGNNLVSFVKIDVDYDPGKLAITNASDFQINKSAFPQIVEGPVFIQGKVVAALSIGSNPAKAITQPTRIGTVTFKVIGSTGYSGTTVTYGTNTQVLALGANAGSFENVIASALSAVITANGQPPVQVCGNAVTDTMVIIDRSGSMNDEAGSAGTKISNAKTSADSFVNILANNNQDKVGLTTFSTTATLNSLLTNDYTGVKNQINALSANGATCIQCAIDLANQEIISHGRTGIKKVAVLLTDGIANTIEGSSNQVSAAVAEQKAIDAVKNSYSQTGTTYYTIGLGNDVNASFLKQIASLTGGQYYFSPTTDQLQSIYQQISQILAKGSVTGTVFNDSNNSGTFDEGEQPLSGWILQLFQSGSNIPKNFTSDNVGNFNIASLCDGTYTLQEIQQPGWIQTVPVNPNSYSITISNGNSVANKNFGNYLIPTPTDTPAPTPTPTLTPSPSLTPSPTLTLMPTVTLTPTTTTVSQLALRVFLHGIGASGDNSNPTANSFSNKNPLHTTRSAAVSIFDSTNQLVASGAGDVMYSSTSGSFSGTITLAQPIATGDYTVKVRMGQHLTRLLSGIQTITAGQTTHLPDATLITGDANNDNKLDILDYNLLIGCYSDIQPPVSCDDATKLATDFNDDGSVNQFDYNLFLREVANQPGE